MRFFCAARGDTSYERDSESQNDYALARSYANRLARFMSPDPLGGDGGDPQSLNRYTYVENDPIDFLDPLGLCGGPPGIVTVTIGGRPAGPGTIFTSPSCPGGGGDGEPLPLIYARTPRDGGGNTSGPANNAKPTCFPTSSLNWLQKAQLTAAQFYANLTGWTFGFGAGLDAGAGIGSKGSKWNFGLGGSASTLIVADASGNAGFLNSVSGGFSAVKMSSASWWGAGAAAGPSFLVSPNPISTIAGPSASISAGGGAVLGAGVSLTTSGAATFTFGVGAGGEAGISPQGGTSQFIPFCHN